MTTEKKNKKPTEPQDQSTFLDKYVDKKCTIRLTSGHPVVCTIKEIRAYEVLVEEGMVKGQPIQKVLFKHAIAMIEERQ